MASGLKLSMSSQCTKYLMCIFNLLFVLTGIILITTGSIIHSVYNDYQHFLDNKFLSVPTLLIVLGTIIFFIAFFGCCGAFRENYCMIITFATLLALIFVLEIFSGISGYILRDEASDLIKIKMHDTMNNYNNSTEIKIIWDNLQRDFKCCGIENSSDWNIALNTTFGLPVSCCEKMYGEIENSTCTSQYPHNVFKTGCLSAFGNFVKDHAVQLGGVGIGFSFVQVLGIVFAFYLARSIRNTYETV